MANRKNELFDGFRIMGISDCAHQVNLLEANDKRSSHSLLYQKRHIPLIRTNNVNTIFFIVPSKLY